MKGTNGLNTQPQRPQPELGMDWIVLADSGGSVPALREFALVAKAVRDLLLARWPDEAIPEIVSGHAADGSRSRRPHTAVLPLAFIGPSLADGRLMGLAIVLPRADADTDTVAAREMATAREGVRQRIVGIVAPSVDPPLELLLGSRGVWRVEPRGTPLGFSLDPGRYLGPARTWASLTPIVLDRFPKPSIAAEAIVADACALIGLPRPDPVGVHLGRTSVVPGAPPSQTAGRPWGDGGWSLPTRRDGSHHSFEDRLTTHAVISFSAPVPGPVVLGAGRFMGLGLCLPVADANQPR